MEIVIVIIMLLVGFNFVLKLTYHNLLGKLLTCAVAALFVGLMWEEATTQSKTQISDWLNRPELMLDTSVLLTVDVFFQVAFCVMMAKKLARGDEAQVGDTSEGVAERLDTKHVEYLSYCGTLGLNKFAAPEGVADFAWKRVTVSFAVHGKSAFGKSLAFFPSHS